MVEFRSETVLAGLDPAIHAVMHLPAIGGEVFFLNGLLSSTLTAWVAGSSPAMTILEQTRQMRLPWRPPVLQWRLESGPDGNPRIVAANKGGRYARINELKLSLPDGRTLPTKQLGQTPYVLPNSERRWTIDDPRQAIRSSALVTVTGVTNAGPLQEKLSLKG